MLKKFSQMILFIWGWKIVGKFPQFSKAIITVAPHRKGFPDVLLGWCVQNIQPIPNMKFFAKYDLFQLPIIGWILKGLGGVPVVRDRDVADIERGNYIKEMITEFNNSQEMTLVITPEGTRKENTPWKKGFYYIALGADVPIIMVAFDYQQKRVIIEEKILHINEESNKFQIEDLIIDWYREKTFGNYRPMIYL